METTEGGWEMLRDSILEVGKEMCGETTGNFRCRRETWWWNERVQQLIREKKKAYKKWQGSRDEKDREENKLKNKEAKREVAIAKTVQRDMEELGIDESLASDRPRWKSPITSHALIRDKLTINNYDDDDG